jgi:hypothetical protein
MALAAIRSFPLVPVSRRSWTVSLCRRFSDIHFNATDSEVEEIIENSLVSPHCNAPCFLVIQAGK